MMVRARLKISVSMDISVLAFYGYIGYIRDISVDIFLWIYRIYRRYIGGYFFMNIDISKINKKYFEIHKNIF